jgi:hypothetical protein
MSRRFSQVFTLAWTGDALICRFDLLGNLNYGSPSGNTCPDGFDHSAVEEPQDIRRKNR